MRRILITALVLNVIRLMLPSLVQTPRMVLLLQRIRSPAYVLMWGAGVAHAKSFTPAGMEATAQGLFSSTYSGLGAVAGAILGGFLYEHVCPHLIYRWASLIVFVGLALHITSQHKIENGGL
ncbi:MAG: MFS transporter [Anaerolineales bacterium]|nr:MFS transporter [Anaerolineales bacterium]